VSAQFPVQGLLRVLLVSPAGRRFLTTAQPEESKQNEVFNTNRLPLIRTIIALASGTLNAEGEFQHLAPASPTASNTPAPGSSSQVVVPAAARTMALTVLANLFSIPEVAAYLIEDSSVCDVTTSALSDSREGIRAVAGSVLYNLALSIKRQQFAAGKEEDEIVYPEAVSEVIVSLIEALRNETSALAANRLMDALGEFCYGIHPTCELLNAFDFPFAELYSRFAGQTSSDATSAAETCLDLRDMAVLSGRLMQ